MAEPPHRCLAFDGRALTLDAGDGRMFQADRRCFEGEPAGPAFANVCALPEEEAQVRFDDPIVQQLRRDVLAWWVALLGDSFVCFTTLALDASNCGGAITVARDPSRFGEDPSARMFAPTVVESELFCLTPPPVGPVIERYAGAPWPAGSFG